MAAPSFPGCDNWYVLDNLKAFLYFWQVLENCCSACIYASKTFTVPVRPKRFTAFLCTCNLFAAGRRSHQNPETLSLGIYSDPQNPPVCNVRLITHKRKPKPVKACASRQDAKAPRKPCFFRLRRFKLKIENQLDCYLVLTRDSALKMCP